MGGAQPLAVTMNDGVALCVEVDRERIERRLRHPLPRRARRRPRRRLAPLRGGQARRAARSRRPARPTPPRLSPRSLARGFAADIVTDQTSAHDPLNGYVPDRLTAQEAAALRDDDPDEYIDAIPQGRWPPTAPRWSASRTRGAEVFDYGNSLRAEAQLGGFERAFDYPGFVPAYVRPLFCEGKGPFRWVALSGDPADIAATDRAVLEEFPDDEPLHRWITAAGERVAFQGLPARICWLGYGERARLGLRFNEMVATRRAEGADRDRPRPPRLRLGRLALPRDRGDARRLRRDRRLAAAQRPGQHRRRRHLGDRSTTAAASASAARSTPGMVCVADGTDLAAEKLERVLTSDPGMGVIRHADAGYERAIEVAAERGVRIPMREARVTVLRDHRPSATRSCASAARDADRDELAAPRDPAADRRPDRDHARRQRRRARRQPGRRPAPDRGRSRSRPTTRATRTSRRSR